MQHSSRTGEIEGINLRCLLSTNMRKCVNNNLSWFRNCEYNFECKVLRRDATKYQTWKLNHNLKTV